MILEFRSRQSRGRAARARARRRGAQIIIFPGVRRERQPTRQKREAGAARKSDPSATGSSCRTDRIGKARSG